MTDLVQSVRALNPVVSCEQPSLQEVWRKVAQGAGPAEVTRPPARRRAQRRAIVAVAAIAVVAAAVMLVSARGHGAVRSGLLSPPSATSAAGRRLANGTITCDFASMRARGAANEPVAARGRSAVAFCRDRYRAPAGSRASRVTFVDCATSATNVAVHVADGRAGQCRRLGERPVPSGYAAAVRGPSASATAVTASAPKLDPAPDAV